MLGTSAKVFPVAMETIPQGDPNIAGALIVGNARTGGCPYDRSSAAHERYEQRAIY